MKITPAIHSVVTSLLPKYPGSVQTEPTATLIRRAAKKRKKLAAALNDAVAYREAMRLISEELAKFGISLGFKGEPVIDNDHKFAVSTGVPVATKELKGYRSFLKLLAQATPEQGVAMLREIGIDWTSPRGKIKV